MADPKTQPSFTRGRKWSIGFNVVFTTAVVFAVVIMLNYLSSHYFRRLYASSITRVELAPRTVSVLDSLTNEVHVTIYYDKNEALFSYIFDLLKEYHARNPKVIVTTVDRYRDPGTAEEMKLKYNLGATTNRDFIIFDCEGHTRIIPANQLPSYDYPRSKETSPDGRPIYDKKLIAFNGEMLFTPAIFAVSNPRPLKVYFVAGHGEKPIDDSDDQEAYGKFALFLRQNFIETAPISLLGTNGVPLDCNLLVIAGPHHGIPDVELEKIETYLDQGGRLLALFNAYSREVDVGLEKVLAKWSVDVTHQTIRDVNYSLTGQDVIVSTLKIHKVTSPFIGQRLHVVLPRRISRIEGTSRAAGAPQVTELAFSSPESVLFETPSAAPQSYPLLVAVEKAAAKSVGERGLTRMIVSGDSFLLGNQLIDDTASANRDFANSAINWLLERTVLLESLGPQRVQEFQLLVDRRQLTAIRWILLAAMPGGVLLLGGLVWFRRRK